MSAPGFWDLAAEGRGFGFRVGLSFSNPWGLHEPLESFWFICLNQRDCSSTGFMTPF